MERVFQKAAVVKSASVTTQSYVTSSFGDGGTATPRTSTGAGVRPLGA
ncbi:MAG: hypothetical protein QXS54_10835 [Candidatus Methanomethylicaceae archaeon]